MQLVQLQSHLADFQARKIGIVAISVDPVAKSSDLARDHGLSFPLLADPDLKVIRAYGVEDEWNEIAWPAEFLVDAPGVIRWREMARSVGKRPSANDILRAFDETGRE